MILSFSFKSVHNCTSPKRVSVSSAINYNSCLLITPYPCLMCSHVYRHDFPLVCTAVLLCYYLGQYSLHWFCLNQCSFLSQREILHLVQQFLKFGEGMVIYHFNNMMEAVDNLQKCHQHLKFCVHCCCFVIVNKCVHYFSLFYSWKILTHHLARIVNLIFVKSYTNCRLHCLYIVCHFGVFFMECEKGCFKHCFCIYSCKNK